MGKLTGTIIVLLACIFVFFGAWQVGEFFAANIELPEYTETPCSRYGNVDLRYIPARCGKYFLGEAAQ